jgi:CBS domain-containing protein
MRTTSNAPPDGSALALRQTRVCDAMHRGIVTVAADGDLREVAAAMAEHRVHCVVVVSDPAAGFGTGIWGVITHFDLVRALDAAQPVEAAALAATEFLAVPEAAPLDSAVRLMVEHDLTHLIVTDALRRPIGVLSTLDVAAAAAG